MLIGCLAAATTVSAQGVNDRWYATASVGMGTLSSSTLTFNDGTTPSSADASYEASFAGGGTLGYRLGNNWAVEGEIMYRRNELEPIDVPGLGSFTEGDFASLGFGVNALYRFTFGDGGKWSAYVGPGVVWFQEIDIDFDRDGEQEISFESDDTALQLKFGTRYDFNDRWFAEAGATYLTADGVTMELPADGTQTITSDYEHWNLQLGVGLRF
jgi:hypothetical protein